jgi:hypothetical protein
LGHLSELCDAGLTNIQPSAALSAQGIGAEIPQNPAGVRGIGAESPVPGGAGDAPKPTNLSVSGCWRLDYTKTRDKKKPEGNQAKTDRRNTGVLFSQFISSFMCLFHLLGKFLTIFSD